VKLPPLESVVASMRTGAVLGGQGDSVAAEQLEELAATLPEIFAGADTDSLERVALRLGAEPGCVPLAEVLLLSTSRVHVLKPLAGRPGEALVASAAAGQSVGLVLSQVHARAAALEDEAK